MLSAKLIKRIYFSYRLNNADMTEIDLNWGCSTINVKQPL